MGRRGPKPKSKTAAERDGSWRAKDKAQDVAPVFGRLEPPSWMSPAARPYWDALVREVAPLGCLGTSDATSLAAMADLLEFYHRARRQIEQDGDVIESPQGLRMHPLMVQVGNARRDLMRFAQQFGLSPASRNVIAAAVADKDPGANIDEFLSDEAV